MSTEIIKTATTITTSTNEKSDLNCNDVSYGTSGTELGESSEELLAYKLSKRRWAILAGITIFGFLNGLVNELTAILGTMVTLVDLPLNKFVYISQSFGFIAPTLALPTAWLVDRYGLKAAALSSLLLVVPRNITRALLFWPQLAHWQQLKLFYWTISSCSSAQVASIYWCLPLKVSESWFSERERSFAWSCMVAGPLLGSALSSFLSPWLVEKTKSTKALAYTNLVSLLITILAVSLGVNKSSPKEAPSARQLAKPIGINQRSLGESIKCLLTNKDVLIFVLALASFESGESSIRNLMQDILATSGFSQTFCGKFLAIVSIVSAILQLLSSTISPDKPHKTGNSRRCKLYISFQWLSFALYALTLTSKYLQQKYWWLIIASSLLYTICKFWASPAYNNQMAHLIVGSMSEATVGAAGTIASYMLTNIYTVIFVYFRQVDSLNPKHSTTNYCNSILLLSALVSSSSLLYLLCFNGRDSSKSIGEINVSVTHNNPIEWRTNSSSSINSSSSKQSEQTKHQKPILQSSSTKQTPAKTISYQATN